MTQQNRERLIIDILLRDLKFIKKELNRARQQSTEKMVQLYIDRAITEINVSVAAVEQESGIEEENK